MTGLRKVTGLTRGERGEDERLKKMTGAMVWGKRNVTVSAKAVRAAIFSCFYRSASNRNLFGFRLDAN